MGKPELGQKMTCADCATRFYDMARTPIVCPKCGTEQRALRPSAAYSNRAPGRRWLPRAGAGAALGQAAEPHAAEAADEVADDDDAAVLDAPDPDDDDDDEDVPAVDGATEEN